MNNVLQFKPRPTISFKALLSDDRYLNAKKRVSQAKYDRGVSLGIAQEELRRVVLQIQREHEKLLRLAEDNKKLREAFK